MDTMETPEPSTEHGEAVVRKAWTAPVLTVADVIESTMNSGPPGTVTDTDAYS